MSDVKRKQSLYFPEDMLEEIGIEATRLDRSLSWIVQKAWKAARKEIKSMQAVSDLPGAGVTTNDDSGRIGRTSTGLSHNGALRQPHPCLSRALPEVG